MTNRKSTQIFLFLAFALAASGCAPLQPPSATGPKGEPPYPILLGEDSHRKEATLLIFNKLAQQSGNSKAPEPQLQPVTATIGSLPTNPVIPLYLPIVGAQAVMNEEETRESLRRFIRDWHELIGADPSKLSLVERLDQPDGVKLASYEQRPFRYPIRGNYGKLQIRFTADRRILNISSSCIPDADRIQTALAPLSPKLKLEDAIKQVRDNGITYTNSAGNKSTLTVSAANEINSSGLVIYVRPSKSPPEALEFHLAWELQFSNAPIKVAFVDAVNGEIIATE
jgi:hypothetical protein